MRLCSVEGCNKPFHAKLLCKSHHGIMRKRGTPTPPPRRKQNGSGCLTSDGYVKFQRDNKRIYEHVEVAQRALGRQLPRGAVVHHWNENKSDNRPENLLICPNSSYHKLIHQRTDAYEACGHAGWLKCKYCGQYESRGGLYIWPNTNVGAHRTCINEYKRHQRQQEA